MHSETHKRRALPERGSTLIEFTMVRTQVVTACVLTLASLIGCTENPLKDTSWRVEEVRGVSAERSFARLVVNSRLSFEEEQIVLQLGRATARLAMSATRLNERVIAVTWTDPRGHETRATLTQRSPEQAELTWNYEGAPVSATLRRDLP